jgi:hypothetical protein
MFQRMALSLSSRGKGSGETVVGLNFAVVSEDISLCIRPVTDVSQFKMY